jgi:hypothetical protein
MIVLRSFLKWLRSDIGDADLIPAFANRMAAASPMPEAPPVMTAT